MEALITIIVPIYNVSEYLKECLDSILGQTYKNIEIILVDDGSTDNSGQICDDYEKKDNRVVVIHKENGGVSSARNEGLLNSHGDYIGFVDPDDYVDKHIFYSLYNLLMNNNADISVCNYETFGLDNENIGKTKDGLLNQTEAMEMLIKDDEMTSYLWNKLFKAKLFSKVRFEEKCRYEDLRIMHKLFLQAKLIVTTSDVLYYYRLRRGSITNSTMLNNSKELIDALESRCIDLIDCRYYYLSCLAEMLQIRRVLLEIIVNRTDKDTFYINILEKLKKTYKKCRGKMSLEQKIKFRLFFISPDLYAKYLY